MDRGGKGAWEVALRMSRSPAIGTIPVDPSDDAGDGGTLEMPVSQLNTQLMVSPVNASRQRSGLSLPILCQLVLALSGQGMRELSKSSLAILRNLTVALSAAPDVSPQRCGHSRRLSGAR